MICMDLLSNDADGRSLIISASELQVREGMNLQKGMNFRDGSEQLSVFLVLPREGEYTDTWDEANMRYSYEGHDSIAEGAAGRTDDQLLMYASGKPTENGKFYKAANAYKDGMRAEPLQVQVYEKLDPGVYFDKGIFNLIDATYGKADGDTRKVARFYLTPADATLPVDERIAWDERMISATRKADIWRDGQGRCAMCGEQSSLHFAGDRLLCAAHLCRFVGAGLRSRTDGIRYRSD